MYPKIWNPKSASASLLSLCQKHASVYVLAFLPTFLLLYSDISSHISSDMAFLLTPWDAVPDTVARLHHGPSDPTASWWTRAERVRRSQKWMGKVRFYEAQMGSILSIRGIYPPKICRMRRAQKLGLRPIDYMGFPRYPKVPVIWAPTGTTRGFWVGKMCCKAESMQNQFRTSRKTTSRKVERFRFEFQKVEKPKSEKVSLWISKSRKLP